MPRGAVNTLGAMPAPHGGHRAPFTLSHAKLSVRPRGSYRSAMQRSAQNFAAGHSRAVSIDWRVAGALAAMTALAFALLAIPIAGPNRPFSVQLETQIVTWGLWLLLVPLVFAISRRAHNAGLTHWKGIGIQLLGAVLVSLLHSVIFGAAVRTVLPGAGTRIPAISFAVLVSFGYTGDLLRYCLIAAAYHALAYQAEARERALSEAQLSAQLSAARLEALEARLHPHFLFNTLNTVTSLIRSKPESAVAVVQSLADLLRAALRAEPGKEVSLSSELELLQQYVAIQRVRFADRLTIQVHADDDTLSALVPQLVLQPLVENAIRHGIAPREAPGVVTIMSHREGDLLRLSVRDDGVGFGHARSVSERAGGSNGIGLNNTIARLDQLYGKSAALKVQPVNPSGTLVTMDLPYHTRPLAASSNA